MDLRDRAVVVTGAGRGIGRVTAVQLAEQGANLALFDLNANDLEETSAALRCPIGSPRANIA